MCIVTCLFFFFVGKNSKHPMMKAADWGWKKKGMTTQTWDVNLSTAACSALILVCIIWRTPEHKDVRPCSKTSQTDIYKKNADNEGCFCFLTFHSVQCYSFSPSQDIYVNLGFRLVSCLHLVSIISTINKDHSNLYIFIVYCIIEKCTFQRLDPSCLSQ